MRILATNKHEKDTKDFRKSYARISQINTDKMMRRKISPMSENEMEALPTKRLLARLKTLHQCEQSLVLSDRHSDEYISSELIEFKESSQWIAEHNSLKKVLSKREHIKSK